MTENGEEDSDKRMMFDRLRESIGHEPLCNHRPDRGLYIHGFCLPLCARCTGILAGAVLASLACWLLHIDPTDRAWTGWLTPGIHEAYALQLLPGLLMIAPTGIDGLIEYACGIESNNPRRLVTGFLAGVGCVIVEITIRAIL